MDEIPIIEAEDLASLNKSSVQTIGQVFRDIGFVFIKAPEITAILPDVFEEFRKVFNLPEKIKNKYKHPELFYQYGWTPPFTEHALVCRRTDMPPDAKENWFMAPETEGYMENIWPEEVPDFKKAMCKLYYHLYSCGQNVLRNLEYYMNRPKGYFDEMIRNGATRLRAIHYPPVTEGQIGKIVWGCQHTDINLVTVLPASTKKGLWIRRRDGRWIPGNAPENCVISQVGDMLQYLTAREFLSAWHEVRAPEHPTTEGRLSATLFIHPRLEVVLDSGHPRFPIITAGELLNKRLKDINLAY